MKHSKIITKKILLYYKYNKRDLPWRTKEDNNQNPYFTLISEIMLQQTQVKTAISYYEKFIKKWPNVDSLSKANLDEVLTMWSGLGYYNRAKNLLNTAKLIKNKYNGLIPDKKHILLTLPGIGEYTSAAILSFSFGEYAIAMDTNIKRFISRIFGSEINIKKNEKDFYALASKVFPKTNSGKFAQAIMDFSSDICKKRKPDCIRCFLSSYCKYDEKNEKNEKKVNLKKKFSVVLFYFHKNQFFLKKRAVHKLLGGLYEVPGLEWTDNTWPKIPKKFYGSEVLPKVLKYKFSHIELKTKIISINILNKNLKKNGIWIKKQELEKIPVSSLTKKIINYSIKFKKLY